MRFVLLQPASSPQPDRVPGGVWQNGMRCVVSALRAAQDQCGFGDTSRIDFIEPACRNKLRKDLVQHDTLDLDEAKRVERIDRRQNRQL